MADQFIGHAQQYFERLRQVLNGIDHSEIDRFVDLLLQARRSGRNIFFAGNGGSAATSSHFANDLSIGTRQQKNPFKVISLVDNVATLSAIGNDYGYDQIFARQIKVYGQSDDLLVGISASGNSPNLLRAFEAGEKIGLITVSITAFDGGKLKELADHSVHVPTNAGEYGPAEDAHLILDHLITYYFQSVLDAV
ncbi:D-sedoheptulose-7-phosphate isomerase [Arenicellales bacterium IMCC55707]